MKRLALALVAATAVAISSGARVVTAQAAPAPQAPDGAALYRQHCRTCHGARGTPTARMTGLYPDLRTLADTVFLAGLSVDSIVTVIRRGKGRDMKPLADKMTPEEMALVAQFVKTLGRPAAGQP
jgi:mono/diheme cytochrome c family protein